MEQTAIIVIRIIGVLYTAIGVGILLNSKYYKRLLKDYLGQPSVLMLAGFLAGIMGMIILNFHNCWNCGLGVIATAIGWISTIKGTIILLLPKSLQFYSGIVNSEKKLKIMSIFVILVGILLIYIGFGK